MPTNVTISGDRELNLKLISARLNMTPQQLARHYIDKGLQDALGIRNKYWHDRIQKAMLMENDKKKGEASAQISDGNFSPPGI